MNFKKDGERISYEDSFYFENVKFKSMISSKNLKPVINDFFSAIMKETEKSR